MANPTTNYGFVLPTSSDLVTDLPADFDIALQGVDTRLKALQPGTTLGDLAYSSATANTNTRLGIGSTGQVLTVAAGVPSWATASSGAMTELATGSLTSGTTISLTTISSSYKTIELWGYGINCAADFQLTYRLNNDSGTSYRLSTSFGTSSTGTANVTTGYIAEPMDASASAAFRISIPNYAASSTYKVNNVWAIGNHPITSGDIVSTNTPSVIFYNTAAISRIDVTSTQTFSSGTYKLWGFN